VADRAIEPASEDATDSAENLRRCRIVPNRALGLCRASGRGATSDGWTAGSCAQIRS
jgi:hypothetical protein